MHRAVIGIGIGIGVTALALAGCGGSSGSPATTRTVQVTTTVPAPPAISSAASPTAIQTGPISAGPTTTAATACPLISEEAAAGYLGQRLARVTTQTSGGKTVGCQFFDVQGTALATSEHLSGPNQPALQISSARYATATLAHNAMVLTAEKGTGAHAVGAGIAYRTTFDPADGPNQDWAYAVATGTTLVVVLTNQGDSELDAEEVGAAVAAKF